MGQIKMRNGSELRNPYPTRPINPLKVKPLTDSTTFFNPPFPPRIREIDASFPLNP